MGACCSPIFDSSIEVNTEKSPLVEFECKICFNGTTQGKVIVNESITSEDGWSGYIQLLTNIGWKGEIPQTFKACTKDEILFALLSPMFAKNNPSKIRTPEAFIEKVIGTDPKLCHSHLQYIQKNLDYKQEEINIDQQNEK